MQILKSAYEYLLIVGLSSHQAIQTYPWNARNLTSLLVYGLYTVCNVGFLMSGSKDLKEFIDSTYLTVTVIFAASMLVNLIWGMRQLFEFLNYLGDTVDQSKLGIVLFKL